MLTVSFLSFLARSVACTALTETSSAMLESGTCHENIVTEDIECSEAAETTLNRMHRACEASIPRDWDLPMYPLNWAGLYDE